MRPSACTGDAVRRPAAARSLYSSPAAPPLSLLKTLCGPPRVPVMQSADPRQRDHFATLLRLRLPSVRCVLVQPEVRPVGVVVVDVLAAFTPELLLVDRNHVIEAIPSQAPDPALGISILPWRPQCR